MPRSLCALFLAVGLPFIATTAAAQEILLDFDDFAAPSTFAEAPGFREAYRSAGVTFEGGMEVVNENGNFGVVEHSAPAFLAWNNTSGGNEAEEALRFARPVSNVSFLTGSGVPGSVTATAYDAAGRVLATQTIELKPTVMQVRLDASGIASVVITSTAVYGVIDDVRFTWSLVTRSADGSPQR